MSCQQCCGIAQQFNDKATRKKLKRFQRRGPDKTTKLLIDELRRAIGNAGARDLTLLDIGAGLGAIHHALLNGTVSRAIHVEASPAQLGIAREETRRRGHQESVEFLEGDFTSIADRVPAADVVTLDRVICCFDDMPALVRLSADRARRFYGAVFPRDVGWMHVGIGVLNVVQRVKRSPFRVFLHDPREIDARLRASGLVRRSECHTPGWQVVVYERTN
jgi:magnesium-protoporphyrin O-methyltransferase